MDRYEEQNMIDNARKGNPHWNDQLMQHGEATMLAILRDYPFSWLPRDHVLNWIRSLHSA